jgi:hypothetical protein
MASPEPHWVLVGLGMVIGLWWASLAARNHEFGGGATPARLAGAAAFVVVATAVTHGLLVGAALAFVIALLLRPASPAQLLRDGAIPLGMVCAIGAAWFAVAVSAGGPDAGLRRVAAYPYLYLRSLWPVAPALVTLFVVGTAGLMWTPIEAGQNGTSGLRAAALASWVPIIGLGFAAPHGPSRYAFMLLPFLALVAAWPLVALGAAAAKRFRPEGHGLAGLPPLVALLLAGALPGHGLAASWGAVNVDYAATKDPFHADHETPGRALAGVLRPDDIVIAEDETMAYVYVGRVDYWFRRAPNARAFSYLDPTGVPRSKYTGARLLLSAAQIEEVADEAAGRVWFVTTRETTHLPRFYHSPDQAAWLAALRSQRTPEVVGRDGSSALYCLNCSSEPAPDPGSE